jgi:Tol biopolymer transport system component
MLSSGSRLGPYEIIAPLGAGGMGEVYKARDTRLNRIVAIKVLPEALAVDPQFRQRFDQEARAVAALNHPNICTLHDVGRQDSTDFLVMELLEGETLSDRLKKGAVPLDEALPYAMQIADALARAHRAGIVHRDLKPGNIFLARSGGTSGAPVAKLLDFGLAKAGGVVAPGAGLSMLPTTPAGLTAQGTILGTFQYMAPEQLEGKDADARTDIFAFGAVLHEMLTGKKAFEGSSHASLISSIMTAQPPAVSSIRKLTPPALDDLVARCLVKDPDDRWQSARDLKMQLAWIAGPGGAAAPASAETAPGPRSRERLAWISALLLLTLGAVVAAWLARPVPASPAEVAQFVVLPPDKSTFSQIGQTGSNFAISPDGRALVYSVAAPDGVPRLWLRPMASLAARPLDSTEEGYSPFWSPDSRSIGFFARGKLKTIDVEGGAAQPIADAVFPLGGSWGRDGVIVFSADLSHPLLRVSASGGPATPAINQDQSLSRTVHGAPSFLPDGRHFLFTAFRGPGIGSTYLGSLDSNAVTPVVSAAGALYSRAGYLLFLRPPKLMAQAFDVSSFSTKGEPLAVLDVGSSTGSPFAISDTGTLAYAPGGLAQTQVVWVDRAGRQLGVAAPPGAYSNVALSPDDTRIAFDRNGPSGNDVWLMDLQRKIVTRFTFQPPNNNVPVWSPDGRMVAFASSRSQLSAAKLLSGLAYLDIYQRPSNASAPDEPLLKLSAPPIMFPSDWSADSRYLTYYRTDPKTLLDQWVLPLFGDRRPFALLHSEFNENQGQFSPDGKLIAYTSDESGNAEVYVQSFPTLTETRQVSISGGSQPRWNRNGNELFYLASDRKLMAVTFKPGAVFDFDAPHALFDTLLASSAMSQTYSVSRDGQRFLLNTAVDTGTSSLDVVLNWQILMESSSPLRGRAALTRDRSARRSQPARRSQCSGRTSGRTSSGRRSRRACRTRTDNRPGARGTTAPPDPAGGWLVTIRLAQCSPSPARTPSRAG